MNEVQIIEWIKELDGVMENIRTCQWKHDSGEEILSKSDYEDFQAAADKIYTAVCILENTIT